MPLRSTAPATFPLLLPLLLSLAAPAIAATGIDTAAGTEAPFQVELHPVEDLKAVFATVESVRQTKARARIAGTLAGLVVVEGDRVAEGQVIATIVDPKLALQKAALDSRLDSLRAQTRQAEIELARARQLRSSGTGTQQKLDDAQTALDVLRAQTAAMVADRAVVEQQMRDGDVRAPAAGRILQVTAIDGAVAMPGEAVATIATDRHVLRLRLPERHARFIKAGDPVLVGERGLAPAATDGSGGAESLARGTIRLVYPELESGQVVADAEMPADPSSDRPSSDRPPPDGSSFAGGYFVGERVRVLVATGRREVLAVPPGYLTIRSGAELATLADGREVVVRSGRAMPALDGRPAEVEVLSGLRPGDRLVKPAIQNPVLLNPAVREGAR